MITLLSQHYSGMQLEGYFLIGGRIIQRRNTISQQRLTCSKSRQRLSIRLMLKFLKRKHRTELIFFVTCALLLQKPSSYFPQLLA